MWYLYQLSHQEEELKREEEAYFEAKREAAYIAKLQRAKEKTAIKNASINGSRSWLGDDEEWEVYVHLILLLSLQEHSFHFKFFLVYRAVEVNKAERNRGLTFL